MNDVAMKANRLFRLIEMHFGQEKAMLIFEWINYAIDHIEWALNSMVEWIIVIWG